MSAFRKPTWYWLAATVVVLGVSFAVFRSAAHSAPWGKLRVGYLAVAAELPLFVAVERGFLKQEGIEVDLMKFTSSNDLGVAATADRVDIMAGTASNVVFDIASTSGKHHQAFAFNIYSNRTGHVTDHMIVKAGSDIQQLTQLRGRRIASFPGSVNKIFVQLILEKHGVPRDSYQYLEMSPPNWGPALHSGAIDAVSALEPTATQIIHDEIGVSIFPGFYADLMPDVPLSGHWISADFLSRADPEQVRAFIRAYRKAIDFCRHHESEARAYLVKYANVRPDIVDQVNLNLWWTQEDWDAARLQAFVDLLATNGALLKRIDVKSFLMPSR